MRQIGPPSIASLILLGCVATLFVVLPGLVFLHDDLAKWSNVRSAGTQPQALKVTSLVDGYRVKIELSDTSGHVVAWRSSPHPCPVHLGDVFPGYPLGAQRYLIPRLDKPFPVWVLITAPFAIGAFVAIVGFAMKRSPRSGDPVDSPLPPLMD
jgi:hypothetical protein